MTPRDLSNTRAKHGSLNNIDPSSYYAADASTSPSPRASSHSPNTPTSSARPSPSGSGTLDADEEKEREPASGPKRSTSTKAGGGKERERERRKRSRVTPGQLVHLEQLFAVERSPTAARRKEISDMLGMDERQTQVWFQNRRAKAKLLQLQKTERPRAQSAPDITHELSQDRQAELLSLILEDAPVKIIPCTDLSIGSWRRIASRSGKPDLIAYVCDQKQILTWFILSDGVGFKMEVPFDHIIEADFTNAGPTTALATFKLSKGPRFYMKSGYGNPRCWTSSGDWTEGAQASTVLRHDIIGGAVQLASLVQTLRERNRATDVYLHPPTYDRGIDQMDMMHLSTDGLMDPIYQYVKAESSHQPHRHAPPFAAHLAPRSGYLDRRPSQLSRPASSISFPPRYSESPIATSLYGSSYSSTHPPYVSPITDGKNEAMTDYATAAPPTSLLASGSMTLAAAAPYFAQPTPRAAYRDSAPYSDTHYARHSIDHAPMAGHDYTTSSSPPLLTTPYYPPPHLVQSYSPGSSALMSASLEQHAPHQNMD